MNRRRQRFVTPLIGSLAIGVSAVVGWLAIMHIVLSVELPYLFLTGVTGVVGLQAAMLVGVYRGQEHVISQPPLTFATVLTLVRGAAIAVLAGFVFVSPDDLIWIPALLYATAVSLDAVDGYIARITGTVTEIGARLDTEIDALGLLVAATVAIVTGLAPAVYLLVGLARYGFVAGLQLRRLVGKPVTELPQSRIRRINAAAQMGILVVILAPIPGVATSHAIASLAMIPFMLVFSRDWLLATGHRNGPVW